jgi:hypothetical protein
VRGLAAWSAAVPGSVQAPPGAWRARDEGDEHTTGSIDARMLDAYESARSAEEAVTESSRDARAHGPIILTPSEPFVVFRGPETREPETRSVRSPQISEKPRSSPPPTPAPAPRRVAAPIPAAGRPPGTDPDIGEPTVKRAPFSLGDHGFDETADTEDTEDTEDAEDTEDTEDIDDAEDETATDALQTRRSVGLEEPLPAESAPAVDDEEEETRTQHDVGRVVRTAAGGGVIGSLPAATRDLVGLDEARAASRAPPASSVSIPVAVPPRADEASGPGASGATIRMMFNASLGAVTINPAPRDAAALPLPPQRL